MSDFSHGAWAHPPKKRPYLARNGLKWIGATIALILGLAFINFANKAIPQAAFDAVYFDEFKG